MPYQDKSNIARWGHTGGADLRCRGNNWFIPYETINSRDKDRPHPATFPVALVEQCIRLHGKGAATRLLDPFLGIGTSAIAAHRQESKTSPASSSTPTTSKPPANASPTKPPAFLTNSPSASERKQSRARSPAPYLAQARPRIRAWSKSYGVNSSTMRSSMEKTSFASVSGFERWARIGFPFGKETR